MLSCLGCRQPHKFDFFVFPVVRLLFQSFSKTSIFQVMLSIFMGPSSLYLSLDYWVYPLRDYIGDTGCYMFIYCRNIGLFNMQLQSFFVTTFRYVCLFHEKFLLKFNLSPDVSTWCERFKNIFSYWLGFQFWGEQAIGRRYFQKI